MNERQTRFVEAYLLDPNGKQAAIAAGYSVKGAEVTASKLLRQPKVRAALDDAIAARAGRVEVKADDVLRELLRLAHVDIGDAYDAKGDLLPLKNMSADVRRAIHSIERNEWGLKIKFHPKVQPLELLGKHLGLWVDKVEHSGSIARPLKGKSPDEILAALKGK